MADYTYIGQKNIKTEITKKNHTFVLTLFWAKIWVSQSGYIYPRTCYQFHLNKCVFICQ